MKPTALILIAPLALLTLAPVDASPRSTATVQTAAEKTKTAAKKTKDAVVKAAKVTADKTEDGLSKTGEVMTDAWITSRIHARFVDEKLLEGSDIKVATSKHVVTLSGTVITPTGRTRATRVARNTEGVRRVVNRLTIGPKVKD